MLNQVLGGGMASRLFQEVREQRGLAYSVYSYRAAFEETGAFAIYAGTAPERVDELLGVLDDQLERLVADGGVSDRGAGRGQGPLTGSLALSLESSISRMHRLGRSELTLGRGPHPRRAGRGRRRGRPPTTSPGSSNRVIESSERTLAAVGPVTIDDIDRRLTANPSWVGLRHAAGSLPA